MSDNEKNTAAPAVDSGEPAFRYNAAMAQGIEERWQQYWDEHGTFWAANVNGDLKDGAGRNAEGRHGFKELHLLANLLSFVHLGFDHGLDDLGRTVAERDVFAGKAKMLGNVGNDAAANRIGIAEGFAHRLGDGFFGACGHAERIFVEVEKQRLLGARNELFECARGKRGLTCFGCCGDRSGARERTGDGARKGAKEERAALHDVFFLF